MPHALADVLDELLLGLALLLAHVLGPAVPPLGGDQPGHHGVDGDLLGRQIAREVRRRVVHRRVVEPVRQRADEAREMPAMPLMLMMRPVQSRGMIGMNDCVTRSMPISLRLRSSTQSASGQVICRSWRRMPLPALLTTMWTVPNSALRGVRGGFDLRDLAHVGLHRQHLDALLAANLIGGLIERLLAAREDDEVHALLREPAGDGLADSLAGAGDEGDAAFESEVH